MHSKMETDCVKLPLWICQLPCIAPSKTCPRRTGMKLNGNTHYLGKWHPECTCAGQVTFSQKQDGVHVFIKSDSLHKGKALVKWKDEYMNGT